jgi:hypothetical protein
MNLAATRHELSVVAAEHLQMFESGEALAPWNANPARFAFMSGEASLVERAVALSRGIVPQFSEATEEELTALAALPDVLTWSVVAHLDGVDQSELWRRIASAPAARDEVIRKLQEVAAQLLDPQPSPAEAAKPSKEGHGKSERDWFRRLKKSPTRRLFDLAASPDHPLWGFFFSSLVLPLGLLLQFELRAAGDDKGADARTLLRLGAYPERHENVIYERRHERPKALSVPRPDAPETWFGFDALQLSGEQLFAYHWLGFSWKAPLLFDDDVNAYHFLNTLDLSWRLAQEALPPEQWKRVERVKDTERCVHVVVIDGNHAQFSSSHLARAEQHYGVKLEVADVTFV